MINNKKIIGGINMCTAAELLPDQYGYVRDISFSGFRPLGKGTEDISYRTTIWVKYPEETTKKTDEAYRGRAEITLNRDSTEICKFQATVTIKEEALDRLNHERTNTPEDGLLSEVARVILGLYLHSDLTILSLEKFKGTISFSNIQFESGINELRDKGMIIPTTSIGDYELTEIGKKLLAG